MSCQVYDLKDFEETRIPVAITEYREAHKPFQFGNNTYNDSVNEIDYYSI